MPTTWVHFIQELEARGFPQELVDEIRDRVYTEGLELSSVSPLALARWGVRGIFPEGAERLALAMVERGVSTSHLARQVGVSATLVGWWLRGKSVPKPHTFPKLSQLLGLSVRELRLLFPNPGMEIEVERRMLDDGHLPTMTRVYRRLFLAREKAKHMVAHGALGKSDALWLRSYLSFELSLLSLVSVSKVIAVRVQDVLEEEGCLAVHRLQPLPLRIRGEVSKVLRFYIKAGRPLILPHAGDSLFPTENGRPVRRLGGLSDVLWPFAPSEVRSLLLEEARRVFGKVGVDLIRGGERKYSTWGEPQHIQEAWEAYLEWKVRREAFAVPKLLAEEADDRTPVAQEKELAQGPYS